MTAQQIEDQVRRLLSLALRRPVGGSENLSRTAEPAWDSLKHVEIVFLMEDHFEIRFAEAELEDIQDKRDLVRLVEAKLTGGRTCGTAS